MFAIDAKIDPAWTETKGKTKIINRQYKQVASRQIVFKAPTFQLCLWNV